MPPGKAIAEGLFGRFGTLQKLFRGSKPAVPRQVAKQQVTHIHTSTPASAQTVQQASHGSSGRLVNAIVDVFSPLVRAPGVAARGSKAVEPVHKIVGRTANARAGYHTLSNGVRPRSGFGNVRPTAIPRSMNSMGLGSARNFSGSRTVFENVVHNAPLGLRVLGDKDRWDMSRFKREMRAAYIKKQKMEGKGKGKARSFDPFTLVKATPSSFDAYFPVTLAVLEQEKPSVQLILSLNPVNESTSFLSYTEEVEESRFFSAMLTSDLRLLSQMHGAHQARLRNLIKRLEQAGCLETDADTGQVLVKAGLDEVQGQIVITFYGERWSMADVRQVLGLYQGQRRETWYKLVDLRGDDYFDDEDSPMPSTIPSDMEDSLSTFTASRTPSVGSFDDVEEHDRVNASMHVPSLNTPPTVTDSYLWGVNDFIDGLNGSQRPSFISR